MARPPDWAMAHVLQALVYLAAACVLGAFLAWAPASDATLRAALAYGVTGLLGFFAQLVVGVEARLVPLAAWLQAYADGGYLALPPSVHTAVPRWSTVATVALWTAGLPLLAAGLSFDRNAWTSLGAGSLAAAVAVGAAAGRAGLRRLR
jgi:hypothetical protein